MRQVVSAIAIALIVAAPSSAADDGLFRNQVQPILARYGCSTGACHGAAAGKNGFRLSLRGYDDEGDYRAITRHAGGRRITLADPAASLAGRSRWSISERSRCGSCFDFMFHPKPDGEVCRAVGVSIEATMLTPEAQTVLDAAMKLSPKDRHIVADLLWMSLDDATQEQIDAEWDAEIERRLAAVDRGETELLDGEPIMRALREGGMP